ncbi:MAG: pilus assembly protein [Chloroflexi bacterium]|nr:pilus assembly protein [Chloroflexota bacterium]
MTHGLRDRLRARGQGVVEYGLILGGSALVTLVTLVVLGPVLADVIQLITMLIESATGGP